jgi:hypothetical protein
MGGVRPFVTHDEYGLSPETRETSHDARVVGEPPITV